MPKSKRDKKVSLTKTSKKGAELKNQTIEQIRQNVNKYKSVYLFTVHNMRNDKLKELREEWSHSRFLFGKNKIMQIGLGKSQEDEVGNQLHKLSKRLTGQCGLLFTNEPRKYVVDWFANFQVEDYARAGFKATEDFDLPEGPITHLSHAIEPYLRQLGMPTKLDKGVVTLLQPYKVATKGVLLTPEQAKILKLFEHKMATFKLVLQCVWLKDKGFKKLVKTTKGKKNKGDDDGDDNEDEVMDEND